MTVTHLLRVSGRLGSVPFCVNRGRLGSANSSRPYSMLPAEFRASCVFVPHNATVSDTVALQKERQHRLCEGAVLHGHAVSCRACRGLSQSS